MNIRFTIEEENIIAIYAEDSRETTLENILAAIMQMVFIDVGCQNKLMGSTFQPTALPYQQLVRSIN